MTQSNKNIERKEKDLFSDFFNQVSIPFSESKEEIWSQLEENFESSKKLRSTITTRAIAASLALLIVTGISAYFYSKDVICSKGEHLSYILPDNSSVTLNANSIITYHPFRWNFGRTLTLSGEAFFEVKKGKKFLVASKNGRTEVLGTSFNINARNANYIVTCKSGKVRVFDNYKHIQIIQPGEIATIQENSIVKSSYSKNTNLESMPWQNGKFSFEAERLKEVLQEVERQFDIDIQVQDKQIHLINYTGFFEKSQSPEKTLDLICEACSLHYKAISNKLYKISLSK